MNFLGEKRHKKQLITEKRAVKCLCHDVLNLCLHPELQVWESLLDILDCSCRDMEWGFISPESIRTVQEQR